MKKFLIVLLAMTAASNIANASLVEFAYIESANYFKFLNSNGTFFTSATTTGTTSTQVNVTFHYIDSVIAGLST